MYLLQDAPFFDDTFECFCYALGIQWVQAKEWGHLPRCTPLLAASARSCALGTDQHACMYVCMYVCTYVRTYVRMYVCMYVCMYVYMYVYARMAFTKEVQGVCPHRVTSVSIRFNPTFCETISRLLPRYWGSINWIGYVGGKLWNENGTWHWFLQTPFS